MVEQAYCAWTTRVKLDILALTWNIIILFFYWCNWCFSICSCKNRKGPSEAWRRVQMLKLTQKIQLQCETCMCFNYIFSIISYSPCLGRASASLLRLVRLSAPSWFRMPGSISVSCLVSAWPVMVKVFAAREACTLGLLKWMTVPWFVNMLTCKVTNSNTVTNKLKGRADAFSR